MAIQISKLVRVFEYEGTQLPDPNPNATPDQVRELLSAAHPELTNAAVDGPKNVGGKQVYELITSVGTKG